MYFLSKFFEPRSLDDLYNWIDRKDWKLILGEYPETAIQRFLDSGALVSVESASLSELVDRKFKVTRLKDMLRKRGLISSGLKHDLIRRLIETHPEDMKEAVKYLVVLKCSEQGEKLVEHFRTTEGEPPIRDDMSPTEKAKTLKRWALATEAGIVGGTAFEAARRSIKAILSAKEPPSELPKSFRNPHEYDAEYILIPGGRYRYSVTKKMETVQDMYFAKYPVTNRRYSRFIRYLEEREHRLLKNTAEAGV